MIEKNDVKGVDLMEQLSKSDCGRCMSREECREVQTDMLDTLAQFCDENGLRYVLSGGTLLGAIRHKGFIPWDDDIDVNMPRPDCEKLFALTHGRLSSYRLVQPFEDQYADLCEFYRMYDCNTILENTYGGAAAKHPHYQPVFIDIFPIDGLPEDEKQTKRLYRGILVLRKMLIASSWRHIEGKNLLSKSFYLIMALPTRLIGQERWKRWIDALQRKYPFNTQLYVGVTSSGVHAAEEKFLQQDYLQVIDVEFEGKKYHAPRNYDRYLTQLYGDYMQMPPKEKRKSEHGLTMYWRKR